MSGETERDVSGWTVDTLHSLVTLHHNNIQRALDDLRTLMDERFVAQSKAVQVALDAVEKAITKAEAATEKRFESVNEFRAQLTDQAATFIRRTEADVRMNAIAEKAETAISRNTQAITDLDQRSVGRYQEMGNRLGEVDKRLSSRMDLSTGTDAGRIDTNAITRTNVALFLSVLFLIVAIGSILVAILKP